MEVSKNDVETACKRLRNRLKSTQDLSFYLKKINMKAKETVEVVKYQMKPRFGQNFSWEQFFREFKMLLTSVVTEKQGDDFNASSTKKVCIPYAYPKVNNTF